jgi:tetratricopeptide (TPR) repeat protein
VLGAALSLTACQEVRARQYLKDGNEFYRKGEFKQAVESFKKAEAIRPDLPQVYLHAAYAHLSSFVPGDTSPPNQAEAKAAIDSFNQYLSRRPDDEKTRQLMIQTLIDSGRYDDALAFFTKKLETQPKDLESIKALGVISSKAGRFEEGLKWYERRAAVTPTDPEAYYAIGTLCWERLYQRSDKMGQARIDIADRGITALKQAITLKPKYVEAITYVNLLYRERSLGHHVQPQTDPATLKTRAERQAAADAWQKAEDERLKDLDQARYYFTMALGLRGLPVPGSQPASGPASAPAGTKAAPGATKAAQPAKVQPAGKAGR